MERHGGKIPSDPENLSALPGIGDYTVGAILSTAFEKRLPAVDGNVRRVLSRLFLIRSALGDTATRRETGRLAAELVPEKAPGDFNQALMDLGATVCLARNPACSSCPLESICCARNENAQNQIPVNRKEPLPHKDATAGLIMDKENRILLLRRPREGLLGGMWKLPGGMSTGGEKLRECLRRTVREETGLKIEPRAELATVRHAFTHFRMTLHGFSCVFLSVTSCIPAGTHFQWIPVANRLKRPVLFGKAPPGLSVSRR